MHIKDQEQVQPQIQAQIQPQAQAQTQVQEPRTDINEMDEKLFYKNVILLETPFEKEYKLGDLPLILKTRTDADCKEAMEIVSGQTNNIIAAKIMNDCALASSLVSIGERKYDKGTLTERLAAIYAMPLPKKLILWDYLDHFNTYVETIRKKYVNF